MLSRVDSIDLGGPNRRFGSTQIDGFHSAKRTKTALKHDSCWHCASKNPDSSFGDTVAISPCELPSLMYLCNTAILPLVRVVAESFPSRFRVVSESFTCRFRTFSESFLSPLRVVSESFSSLFLFFSNLFFVRSANVYLSLRIAIFLRFSLPASEASGGFSNCRTCKESALDRNRPQFVPSF